MKPQITVVLAVLLVVASACSGAPAALPTSSPATQPVISATITPTATATPTGTPLPSPTSTPVLTDTPVPAFAPILLSGSGSEAVDCSCGVNPAIAHITYTGSGNFVVWNYQANGDPIDLLVNTLNNYAGTVPINLMPDKFTTRFSVEAEGDWTIEVEDFSMVRTEIIPSTFTGTGDDVVDLKGGVPDLLKVDASQADGRIVIWAYGKNRVQAVNESAPYSGTVAVPKDTMVLVITCGGPWSIEITTP